MRTFVTILDSKTLKWNYVNVSTETWNYLLTSPITRRRTRRPADSRASNTPQSIFMWLVILAAHASNSKTVHAWPGKWNEWDSERVSMKSWMTIVISYMSIFPCKHGLDGCFPTAMSETAEPQHLYHLQLLPRLDTITRHLVVHRKEFGPMFLLVKKFLSTALAVLTNLLIHSFFNKTLDPQPDPGFPKRGLLMAPSAQKSRVKFKPRVKPEIYLGWSSDNPLPRKFLKIWTWQHTILCISRP